MLPRLHRQTRLTTTFFLRSNATLQSLRTCPSCHSKLPTPLPTCPNCQYIAPMPSSMSYFHFFDLPDTGNPFAIDTQNLRRRFLQLQRLCHPDIWAQKGEKELALAAAQSSELNKAYQTILSPLSRAQYILTLQGMAENETETLQDENFIMEIMEARQEIEDASDPEKLIRLKDINQGRIDDTVEELGRFIGEKDWEAARKATMRLKYWLGIENAAKERAQY